MASPAPAREACYACVGTGQRTPPVKGQDSTCPRCKGSGLE